MGERMALTDNPCLGQRLGTLYFNLEFRLNVRLAREKILITIRT